MKNRATYDFNGIPIEFFTDEKDIYVFTSDWVFKYAPEKKEILDLPYLHPSKLKTSRLKESDALMYVGRRGQHRSQQATKKRPTPLIKTSFIKEELQHEWRRRAGAKDFLAFIQLVEEDMRNKIIGRVPTPTIKPDIYKKKKSLAPAKDGATEVSKLVKRLVALERKLAEIKLAESKKKTAWIERIFRGAQP